MDPFEQYVEIANRAELKAEYAIRFYRRWLSANEYIFDKINVTRAREFRDYILQQEWSPAYAKRVLGVIHGFYCWYYHAETLSPFRRVKIKSPSRGKSGPKPSKIWVLTPRQIDLIRAAIERLYSEPIDYYRAHLIISMPLYMGIGFPDMRRMEINDVRGEGSFLYWNDRTIPYVPQLRTLIVQYVAARASKYSMETQELLPNVNGVMSTAEMRRILGEISQESRVRLSETILLDTFAYNLALDGAPVGLVTTLRNCPTKRAEEFISLAANSDDITKVYLRSVEQRMRPVTRRRKRIKRVD